MITREQIPGVIGHTAYDPSHRKLGEIGQVYLDSETDEPEWITVRTGLFGKKETFIPVGPAELRGDEVVVPFPQEQIKDAPKVDTAGERLPADEEARLYEYYGLRYMPYTGYETGTAADIAPGTTAGMQPGVAPGMAAGAPEPVAGRDVPGPPADDAMTRSEEHMHVGKEQREAGRARLRKYVVTEVEEQSVPVRREKVRVEREPITEENRDQATAGPEISESEHEVVLHEERPVVSKETTPVERVRLDKETTTEEEIVGGTVRKERVETEGISEDEQQ